MTITEAQLAERAATQQAIEHLKAAAEALKRMPDDDDNVFAEMVADFEADIDVLDEVYGESFIDAGEGE